MKQISIAIIDDHKLVREAWALLLGKDSRFKVIEEFDSAELALQRINLIKPDIILLDICLPGMSGLDAMPLIRQASPNSKVIFISLHYLPAYARKAIHLGAKGYVTKSSTKEEMIEAILTAQKGGIFICNQIKGIIANDFAEGNQLSVEASKLSHRELEIIELLKEGLSSKQIADRLFISCKTVEVHRYNILRKLNIKNSAALINFINKFQP